MLAPIDSPVMYGFVSNLDMVNALAEKQPGFVWRLRNDNNNATSIKVFDNEFLIVNMSVWEDINVLFNFVYRSMHIDLFKRRKDWFEKMDKMHMALWYVSSGHIPPVAEALERLIYLRENNDTPFAFTFKKRFSAIEANQYTKAITPRR